MWPLRWLEGDRAGRWLAPARRPWRSAMVPLFMFGLASSDPARALGQDTWSHLAGDPLRSAICGPVSLGPTPLWVCSTDLQGRTIDFAGRSSPVVSQNCVYALGSVRVGDQRLYSIYAIDRWTGGVVWSSPTPAPYFESRSTPAIDARNRAVVVVVGSFVMAFDLITGQSRWITPLPRPVVNASPVVTDDLPFRNRIFLTDYDGFGVEGRLYCINADPRMGAWNPFDPGEVVWSETLGTTSGNTPAFADGRVFVTSAGDFGFEPGAVACFDARSLNAIGPLWRTENVMPEGFFGGLTASGGSVYTASYAFFGGTWSSNLLKLDAASGGVVWSTPCNRSASIPVAVPGRSPLEPTRVVVSGGLNGFGTRPTVQVFDDLGSSASVVWQSPTGLWWDLNGDGVMDASENLSVGGWSTQPLVSREGVAGEGRRVVLVGTMASTPGGESPDVALTAIDLDSLGLGPPKIIGRYAGAGSSPGVAGGCVYTIGAGGLVALGPAPMAYDVNLDEVIDLEDVYAWEQGRGRRDVDRDGVITAADRKALIRRVRRDER
ncbi:MAG: PQQ-binding-like beta-propeller repeat protein [Phycisphaeraceae bacterium]|nr:MAG: PQQ-binding-like beta-propeller repeat protein [Phycisphaeraceae bacterium]